MQDTFTYPIKFNVHVCKHKELDLYVSNNFPESCAIFLFLFLFLFKEYLSCEIQILQWQGLKRCIQYVKCIFYVRLVSKKTARWKQLY